MKAAKYGSGALALVLMACTPSIPEDGTPLTEADPQSTVLEETTRRVPQFENEYVEVWKSIIVPNQPLTMHRHDHPRALIALKGGTLRRSTRRTTRGSQRGIGTSRGYRGATQGCGYWGKLRIPTLGAHYLRLLRQKAE